MSRRRCCCNSASGPCQPCPTGTKEWTLYVEASGIINDSAGDGLLFGCLDFKYPDCAIEGTCERQVYRRKAVGNTEGMEDICELEICDSIVDEAAPTASGSHLMQWDWCPGTDRPLCDFVISGGTCGANIADVQDGAVTIDVIIPNAHWNFTTCERDFPETNNECATLVVVTYRYSDSFDIPRWDTVDGNCVSVDIPFYPSSAPPPYSSHEVEWKCTYGRRVATGEFFAEGSYQLLRCEYPPAYRTYLPTDSDLCFINGGVVCASAWDNLPTVPTTWQPPESIDLIRSV